MSPTDSHSSSEPDLLQAPSGNVTEAHESEPQPGTSHDPPLTRSTRRRENPRSSAASREMGNMQKIGEDLVEFLKSIHENVSKDTDDDLHFLKSLLPSCQLVNVMDKFDMRCELIQVIKRYAAKSGNEAVLSQMTPEPPYPSSEQTQVQHEKEQTQPIRQQTSQPARAYVPHPHATDPLPPWHSVPNTIAQGSSLLDVPPRYPLPAWPQGSTGGAHGQWHVPHADPYGSMARQTWQRHATPQLHPLPHPVSYGDLHHVYRPLPVSTSASELLAQTHAVLADSGTEHSSVLPRTQEGAPQSRHDDFTERDN